MLDRLSNRKKRTASWLALPILLAWVWAGYASLMQRSTYTGIAEGEVLHLQKSRTGRTAPVIRYEANDGNPYEFQSMVYAGKGAYVEGQKVVVRYRPDNPTDARIPGFLQNNALVLVFTIIWGFLSAIGYLIAFHSGQRNPNSL